MLMPEHEELLLKLAEIQRNAPKEARVQAPGFMLNRTTSDPGAVYFSKGYNRDVPAPFADFYVLMANGYLRNSGMQDGFYITPEGLLEDQRLMEV